MNTHDDLDRAFAWLGARARRLALEAEADTGQPRRGHHPCKCELTAALEDERRLHEARGDVLVNLCREHDLGEGERTVLVALAALAVGGPRFAESLLGGLGSLYGGIAVDDLVALLDPKSVADRIAGRRLFESGGKLVKAGLVVVEEPNIEDGPEALWSCRVTLTPEAYEAIVR